jgi:hypothetical protein
MVSQSRCIVSYEKPFSASRFHIGFIFHSSFIEIWYELMFVSLTIRSFIDGFHRLVRKAVWCIEVAHRFHVSQYFIEVWYEVVMVSLMIRSFIDDFTK